MPTSTNRHPSRDAVMRDALNQLREQHGVTLEDFSFHLNSLVHAMCPGKVADQAALSSFTNLTADATRAIAAWTKRVQRWANGDTEFPAWLEEPWVAALEVLGDSEVREQLTFRHGYLAVPIPSRSWKQSKTLSPFLVNARIHEECGSAMAFIGKMLADGRLDRSDRQYAERAVKEIRDAMSALSSFEGLIAIHVIGETLQ